MAVLAGCSGPGAGDASHLGPTTAGSMAHEGIGSSSTGPLESLPGVEARTVRGAITAMFVAYDHKDLARWLGSWTDSGYRRTFGVTKREAALVPPSWGNVRSFRESQVELVDIVAHGVHALPDDQLGSGGASEHGRGEHAVIDTVEAGIVTRQRLDLVQEQGRWRVDGRTWLPPRGQGDLVEVRLTEHRITLTRGAADRDLVLRALNLGHERHELLLLRDRGGQDETVGRISPIRPGETRDLVGRDLPPGAYTLVCNLLDDHGTPHSVSACARPCSSADFSGACV